MLMHGQKVEPEPMNRPAASNRQDGFRCRVCDALLVPQARACHLCGAKQMRPGLPGGTPHRPKAGASTAGHPLPLQAGRPKQRPGERVEPVLKPARSLAFDPALPWCDDDFARISRLAGTGRDDPVPPACRSGPASPAAAAQPPGEAPATAPTPRPSAAATRAAEEPATPLVAERSEAAPRLHPAWRHAEAERAASQSRGARWALASAAGAVVAAAVLWAAAPWSGEPVVERPVASLFTVPTEDPAAPPYGLRHPDAPAAAPVGKAEASGRHAGLAGPSAAASDGAAGDDPGSPAARAEQVAQLLRKVERSARGGTR
ncbi:hypothetical protein SAMN06265365_109129 [Tistlia consotensis]|uniref:Uncharacterized protein n=1 Tax=Tistlia consotensis USBA 355 TaxID=560819 RepID=A0A1Y6CFR3_9PROT|nr:hypothetical protein [Tistlia consotensis]SMF59184.1 hypothetical protein SAMN05428998_12280 [Tistlia consotensis USBA 355]SNR64218.1 hypothetical protein SAMN06265365_109129 [Tistlia consotensis]